MRFGIKKPPERINQIEKCIQDGIVVYSTVGWLQLVGQKYHFDIFSASHNEVSNPNNFHVDILPLRSGYSPLSLLGISPFPHLLFDGAAVFRQVLRLQNTESDWQSPGWNRVSDVIRPSTGNLAAKYLICSIYSTVMAMVISYNWLFLWDFTFYKWGDLLVLTTGKGPKLWRYTITGWLYIL